MWLARCPEHLQLSVLGPSLRPSCLPSQDAFSSGRGDRAGRLGEESEAPVPALGHGATPVVCGNFSLDQELPESRT